MVDGAPWRLARLERCRHPWVQWRPVPAPGVEQPGPQRYL